VAWWVERGATSEARSFTEASRLVVAIGERVAELASWVEESLSTLVVRKVTEWPRSLTMATSWVRRGGKLS